jgi:hypothetical protein
MKRACRRTSAATAMLLLVSCASQQASSPSAAPSIVPAPKAQLLTKPRPNPDVLTTLDVSVSDSATAAPAAVAAAQSIGRRIAACWEDREAPDAPIVVLQVTLTEDGSVGAVETTDKGRFAAEPAYRAAAAAATRALFQCAPYSLPASDFAAWNSLSLKLTPNHV